MPNPRDAFATEEQYQAWLKGHAAAGEALASAVPVGKALSWLGRFAKGAVANVVAKVAGKADEVAKVADGAKAAPQLSKEALKSISSLERQIAKHEGKLAAFRASPTVRQGMKKLPKEVIERQQQARIQHLEKEIQTFKDNIEKIRRGEL